MNNKRNSGPYFSAAHGRYVENDWRESAIQRQQYTGERPARQRPQHSTWRVRLFLIGVVVGLVAGLAVAQSSAATAECMTDLECEQMHGAEVNHG